MIVHDHVIEGGVVTLITSCFTHHVEFFSVHM